MNTKIITTQIKREFWENKSGFIYWPMIVTALVLTFILGATVFLGRMMDGNGIQFNGERMEQLWQGDFGRDDHGRESRDLKEKINKMDMQNFKLQEATDKHPAFFGAGIVGAIIANTTQLSILFFFVLLVYAHITLFDDRKSREILFWRSMPISETTNVLVKLGILILVAPIFILALNIIVGLLTMIISLVFFLSQGIALSDILTSMMHSEAATISFEIFGLSLILFVLLSPIFVFALFCSAFTKRSPLLTSSLIPIGLMIIDKTARSTFGLNLHIIDNLHAYVLAVIRTMGALINDAPVEYDAALTCFIAVVLATGLLGATIWLRNHRYEI
jgi:MFS family permease